MHFVRHALELVAMTAQQMFAATIRTVFVQSDTATAREAWLQVADGFFLRWPHLATLLDEAGADVLAELAFPAEHWRQIWSTNPLERLNMAVARRSFCAESLPKLTGTEDTAPPPLRAASCEDGLWTRGRRTAPPTCPGSMTARTTRPDLHT